MAVVPFFLFRTGGTATCDVIDDLGNLVLDDLGNQVQAPCNTGTAGAVPFFLFRTGSPAATVATAGGIPFFLFRAGSATASSTEHFLGVYVANNALTVTVF